MSDKDESGLAIELRRRYLECGICTEMYDEDNHVPQLLPCLHTFCKKCISKLHNSKTLTCPLCNKTHTMNDLSCLPKDNTRRDLTGFLATFANFSSKSCDICMNIKPLECKCEYCSVNMCSQCQINHQRQKPLHSLTILAHPGTVIVDESCKKEGHENGRFNFFCKSPNCQKVLCAICAIKEHWSHEVEVIDLAYYNRKESGQVDAVNGLRIPVLLLTPKRIADFNNILHSAVFGACWFLLIFVFAYYNFKREQQLIEFSDEVPEMHFVFDTSHYLFPCRSYDNTTTSTRPYSGLICNERRFKYQGIFGNIPFKNDQEYSLVLVVRIEDLQLVNDEYDENDEAMLFEIGLSDQKVHKSHLYDNKEHTWVVYGTKCGDGVCVTYNDRIAPYIFFLKGDNNSGLWEVHFNLWYKPENKQLQIISNFSTYSFTNISGNSPLWPVYAIYYNNSLTSISIVSSSPSFLTFDQSTLSAGLYLSLDSKTLTNRNKLDSQNKSVTNVISSLIFTESVNIKCQKYIAYALEIQFDENRYLPNNTIIFETGFFINERIDTADGYSVFVNYDYMLNSSTYNMVTRNGSSVICKIAQRDISTIRIRIIVHFDIIESKCHVVFICDNFLTRFSFVFKDRFVSTVPQFFIRKWCTFCTPDVRTDIKRLKLFEMQYFLPN